MDQATVQTILRTLADAQLARSVDALAYRITTQYVN